MHSVFVVLCSNEKVPDTGGTSPRRADARLRFCVHARNDHEKYRIGISRGRTKTTVLPRGVLKFFRSKKNRITVPLFV